MSASIVLADYYNAMVHDQPGVAYELLAQLADRGVSLMAFNAVPMGSGHAQLVLFPTSPSRLARAAEDLGLELKGPQHAIVVRGDDRLPRRDPPQALRREHQRLRLERHDRRVRPVRLRAVRQGGGRRAGDQGAARGVKQRRPGCRRSW